MSFLFILIDLYSLVLFGSVILSWIQVSPDNPVARVIHQLTEPVLSRVRNVLPAAGGFDFSPMVLLIGLQLLKGLLVRL
jgi:YggT family protein